MRQSEPFMFDWNDMLMGTYNTRIEQIDERNDKNQSGNEVDG
jgi:hypothetical protein